MGKKTVIVLMSTYNGEKYIREQLDSIIAQEGIIPYLIVRDDGSTDTTISIIKEYIENYPEYIKLIEGQNIGYATSFAELIRYALSSPTQCRSEWYAFADQDDVWNKNKLSHAIDFINNSSVTNQPVLYCSNTEKVDQYLNHLEYRWNPQKVSLSKERCLIESFATGCTLVFNQTLAKLFVTHYKPSYPAAHDYFMYQLATYCGTCLWDKESYIKYRQHGNNCIGIVTPWEKIKRKFLKTVKRETHFLEIQANSFLNLTQDILSNSDKSIILNFINYRSSIFNKIKLICNKKYRYTSRYMTYMLWIRILRGVL